MVLHYSGRRIENKHSTGSFILVKNWRKIMSAVSNFDCRQRWQLRTSDLHASHQLPGGGPRITTSSCRNILPNSQRGGHSDIRTNISARSVIFVREGRVHIFSNVPNEVVSKKCRVFYQTVTEKQLMSNQILRCRLVTCISIHVEDALTNLSAYLFEYRKESCIEIQVNDWKDWYLHSLT